jgi:hypothetical protein
MEARNRTLPDWFTRVRTRQVALPRFQRHEAWSHAQATALLDTVLAELPAGAVLILEVGDEEPFVSKTVVGAPMTGERVAEHLLDGQQRLTALWRMLTDDYEERSYFVSLDPDEETGQHFHAESYSRWVKDGKRYPVWLDSPQRVWAAKLIPAHLLRPDADAEAALKEWANLAADGEMDVVLEIRDVGATLRQKFANFNLPFLSLPRTTAPDIALNVFIHMNTSATPLSAYDIVVAQVEAGTGRSLHDMVDELHAEVPHLEHYASAADLLLAVSALLQDRVPTRGTYLAKGFSGGVLDHWEISKRGIKRAVDTLEAERIYDGKRLPTDVVLYPLAALWAVAPEGLDAEGEARNIILRYLWRAFFTDRYERTSATRSLVDFRQIRALAADPAADVPLIFDDTQFRLPSIEELMDAGWPVRKDRLPRAILAMALGAGGLDFADGNPVSREELLKREYHHLFPRAWLEERGVSERLINRSLNCALVTWRTNRNISAKTPSDYLNERIEGSSLGEPEVRRRLASHLIPYDAIAANDYDAFIEERAALIFDEMTKRCGE